MFLSICDYEIGILERMMVCASQQAGPRSHTNQGETRAASTFKCAPWQKHVSPLLLVSNLCASHSLPKSRGAPEQCSTRGAASYTHQGHSFIGKNLRYFCSILDKGKTCRKLSDPLWGPPSLLPTQCVPQPFL